MKWRTWAVAGWRGKRWRSPSERGGVLIAELLGAMLIGLSLGLLGSGGAILTVPILVYLAGHGEKQAIVESLAIVGLIALSGAVRNGAHGRVDVRSVVVFGIPGMAGAFLGALVAKWIPGAVQLALLGVVMGLAAWFMFRGRADEGITPVKAPTPLIAAQGLGVGGLTGLLGVGGGFLIVPALALLARLPVKEAIGTSLAIIAMNCAAGFVKSWRVLDDAGGAVDWVTVAIFSGVGIAGGFVGVSVGGKLDQKLLRRIFAVFLVLMALFILVKQAPRIW